MPEIAGGRGRGGRARAGAPHPAGRGRPWSVLCVAREVCASRHARRRPTPRTAPGGRKARPAPRTAPTTTPRAPRGVGGRGRCCAWRGRRGQEPPRPMHPRAWEVVVGFFLGGSTHLQPHVLPGMAGACEEHDSKAVKAQTPCYTLGGELSRLHRRTAQAETAKGREYTILHTAEKRRVGCCTGALQRGRTAETLKTHQEQQAGGSTDPPRTPGRHILACHTTE